MHMWVLGNGIYYPFGNQCFVNMGFCSQHQLAKLMQYYTYSIYRCDSEQDHYVAIEMLVAHNSAWLGQHSSI